MTNNENLSSCFNEKIRGFVANKLLENVDLLENVSDSTNTDVRIGFILTTQGKLAAIKPMLNSDPYLVNKAIEALNALNKAIEAGQLYILPFLDYSGNPIDFNMVVPISLVVVSD